MKPKRKIYWLLLLMGLPAVLPGQAYPMNNSNSNNSIDFQLTMQYSVLMNPMYGYGNDEQVTNFSARNFWSEFSANNPHDANAWFNYYRSTRFIAEGSAGFAELQPDLDSIADHLKRFSDGTWEQLIVQYWNSNRDPKLESILNKAYALRPADPLTLRFMTGMEYLHGKQAMVYDYYRKWKNTGDLPLATENYAYNVMQSVPKDAVLITNGEMDTYPLLYHMQSNGTTTVKLVSMGLCARSDNRSKALANAGLTAPDGDLTANFDADYISRLAAANPTKKIYVAATCGPDVLKALQSNLYCTGLAYRYSETPVENLNFLRDNVGTRFRLDNVGKAVRSTHHFDVHYADRLEMNYYLPLLIAADAYVQAGNAQRAAELRQKAKGIRERAGYNEPLRSEE